MEPKVVTYNEARELIKSGDVINMYRHTGGLLPILHGFIQFFTGSKVYHTAVAIWMQAPGGEKRLMIVETNLLGGKRIVPLSMYLKGKMEVLPLPEQYSFEKMEPKAMERIGVSKYGFIDLFTIGIREFFGLKTKSISGQVCSELVADLLVDAGVPLLDTHVSPGKLRNELEKLGMIVTMVIPAEK